MMSLWVIYVKIPILIYEFGLCTEVLKRIIDLDVTSF